MVSPWWAFNVASFFFFYFLFFLQENGVPCLKPSLGSGQEKALSEVHLVFATQAAPAALFLLDVTFISLPASLS